MNSVQASLGEIILFYVGALGLFGNFLLFAIPRLFRTGNQLDWMLRIFVAAMSTLLLIGWIAFVAALLGRYSLGWVALWLFVAIALVAAIASRFKPGSNAFPRGNWYEVGLALLLIGASVLYFRPHEYVLGGSDAGSYINAAAATARTGSYLQFSAWNRFLTEHADVTLRSQPPQMRTEHLQFVGWYFDDADATLARPQFFPFHPVLLAVGMSLGNVPAALLMTPLAALLGIAALYFLARQLFGKPVAFLSALFLTVTSTQIFFARYPTTEPLTLLLLFSGFLAFQILWDDPDASPAWGAFGGAALGAAILTRIDLPLVVAAIVVALVLRRWQRKWSAAWRLFALTFLFFFVQFVLVSWLISWPYVWNTYYAIYTVAVRSAWLVGAGVAGLLALILSALVLGTERFALWVRKLESSSLLRWSLAALLIALSVYAYFLRPILEPARSAVAWPGDIRYPILNGQNWVRLGWYLTPLGIALATAGIAIIVVRERLTRIAVVIGIGVLTTFQYVYNILNTPYHIYAMRRYVPIVIPMLWIFAAYAIVALPRLPRSWLTYGARGAIVLALVSGLIYQDRYVLPARDFADSFRQLNELQAQLHPNAILLIAEPAEALFGDTFGVPLQEMFGHPIATVRVDGSAADPLDASGQEERYAQITAFLDALTAFAAAQQRPIQLLAVDSLDPVVRDHLQLQPAGAYGFTTQMLMNTYTDFPSVTQTVHYGIEIYDVSIGEDQQQEATVIEADIGSIDAAYIGSGFYAKEFIPGAPTMRWTGESASVTLPLPQNARNEPAAAWEIHVQAMIYRPAAVEPAEVVVSVNDQRVGSFTPSEEWKTFVFPVPDDIIATADVLEIGFVTDAFVPAEIGVNNDERRLGFLLDWVKIMPTTVPPSS